MPDKSELKSGNWVLYLPENCYCTIISLGESIFVQALLRQYECELDQLTYVNLTADILSQCKFRRDGNAFFKTSASGERVKITYESWGDYTLISKNSEGQNVRFVHRLQNAYLKATGEILSAHIYGVRES